MKKTYIFGIVLIAIAIAAIMSMVSDSTSYADFNVAAEQPSREFHVVGKLNKEKGLYYKPEINPNLFAFYLIDKDGIEKRVSYNGSKPQDFEKSEQIVVVGKMTGEEFQASGILMKCPSKYTNSSELKEITKS